MKKGRWRKNLTIINLTKFSSNNTNKNNNNNNNHSNYRMNRYDQLDRNNHMEKHFAIHKHNHNKF